MAKKTLFILLVSMTLLACKKEEHECPPQLPMVKCHCGKVVEIGTIPNQLFNNHYVVGVNNCTGRSRTFYNSTPFSPEITSICLGDTLEAW
jgi:hypothetical protein